MTTHRWHRHILLALLLVQSEFEEVNWVVVDVERLGGHVVFSNALLLARDVLDAQAALLQRRHGRVV